MKKESNNQSLQAGSNNLPIPSNEQQKIQILTQAASQVSISIRKEALEIIQAEQTPLVQDTPMPQLIKLIGKQRALLGSINADESQLNLEASFLSQHYGHLHVADIDRAFLYFVKGMLDMQTPDYFNFSCMMIANVLKSYRRFKNGIKAQINQKAEKELLALDQPDNSKLRLAGIRDCIWDCYQHSLGDSPFRERFYNQLVYDFLRKTGRLVLQQELIDESKKYAERKFFLDIEENKKKIREMQVKKREDVDPVGVKDVLHMPPALTMDRTKAIRQYAIDFCLLHYFKLHKDDLETQLSKITENDLKKVTTTSN